VLYVFCPVSRILLVVVASRSINVLYINMRATIRFYTIFIALSVFTAIAGAYFNNKLALVSGAGFAIIFLSLEIGIIIHQYSGMAKLVEIHNNLLVATLKAMGYEIEGDINDKIDEST
jgi:hypothetical protein